MIIYPTVGMSYLDWIICEDPFTDIPKYIQRRKDRHYPGEKIGSRACCKNKPVSSAACSDDSVMWSPRRFAERPTYMKFSMS